MEQAVPGADVEASSAGLKGEVPFAAGELLEGGGEVETPGLGRQRGEVLEHGRQQHVHAEETEVMPGAEAGDNEALFGDGGSWFFEDVGNLVEGVLAGDAASADRTEVGKLAFVGGLDGGNGAVLGAGDLDELARAGLARAGDVQVIPKQQKERRVPDEFAGHQNGVAVAPGFGLHEKPEAVGPGPGCGPENGLVAGRNHDADLLGPGRDGFLDDDAQGGAGFAVSVHQGLKGKGPLMTTGGGDDGLGDLHVRGKT